MINQRMRRSVLLRVDLLLCVVTVETTHVTLSRREQASLPNMK